MSSPHTPSCPAATRTYPSQLSSPCWSGGSGTWQKWTLWWVDPPENKNTVTSQMRCYSWMVNLEILLEGVRELLAIFHKFSFSLLESVFSLCSRNVGGHLVHCVQQLLDGTRNLLDRLQECLAVRDLVRDSWEDLLQVRRLSVQLLEWLLCPGAAVL